MLHASEARMVPDDRVDMRLGISLFGPGLRNARHRPYWIATTRRFGFVPPNTPSYRLIGFAKPAKHANCIHGVVVEVLNQGLVWIVGFEDARSDRTPEAQSKQVNITALPLQNSSGTAP
jgi:hypothetical protein